MSRHSPALTRLELLHSKGRESLTTILCFPFLSHLMLIKQLGIRQTTQRRLLVAHSSKNQQQHCDWRKVLSSDNDVASHPKRWEAIRTERCEWAVKVVSAVEIFNAANVLGRVDLVRRWWHRASADWFPLFACLSSHFPSLCHESMPSEKENSTSDFARSNDRLFMSDAIQITMNIVEYVRDREKIDRINYGTMNGRCHRAGLFTCPIL